MMITSWTTDAAATTRTGTEFSRYVRSQELLSLQNFRTTAAAEPSFLITTQVMELLFQLCYLEARTARDRLAADDVEAALATLRRLRAAQRAMNEGWGILSTLSPVDYLQFRDALGDGSGFQSFAYRQWECVLGKKDAAVAEPYLDDPVAGPRLRAALSEPSLYDATLGLLARRGIELPAHCLNPKGAEQPRHGPEVEDAWRRVYAQPEQYADLYRVAEELCDVAYEFARWQATHVLVVERVLGAKKGTGGTTGVQWLREAATRRVFGELWSVRENL